LSLMQPLGKIPVLNITYKDYGMDFIKRFFTLKRSTDNF